MLERVAHPHELVAARITFRSWLCADRRKTISNYLGDLFKVPLQVLPFYARIVATLSQQYQDIGTAVAAMVVRKVKGLAKKVDATNKTAEPRVASARYLAELAKFRVVDPGAPHGRAYR